MKTTAIFACSVILLAFAPRVSASPYYFIEINFPGAGETIALGVSENGTVVGTYGSSLDVREPTESGRLGFIWNPVSDVYESLSAFGSIATNANSINDSGIVVGDYFTNNRLRGFVYNPQTDVYTDVMPTGVNAQEATISDITDDGVIIGSFSTNRSLSQPDLNDLQVVGFRAFPDGTGSYSYETFEASFSTATYGGSRNSAGTEVGLALDQSVVGIDFFAYKQPIEESFVFPGSMLDANETLLQTSFAAINDPNVILGNALIQTGSGEVANRSFLLQNGPAGLDLSTVEVIDLPCPTCSSPFDFDELRFAEAGKSIATNISDTGLIVGFNDNNDGIYAGFLGIPVPDGTQPGDFDLDNDVDGSDFLAWQRGESLSPLSGTDLIVWSANFGTPAPLAAGSATVPEPRSWLLVLIGCVVTCCHCQRLRSSSFSSSSQLSIFHKVNYHT